MYLKCLTLVLLCFGITSLTLAQCPNTYTFLSTQADIDNFPTDYPGCTMLPNGLNISTGNNLTNLDGLSGLTSIGGDLYIDNPFLPNLDGLSGLTSIGGDLFINFNDALTDIDGLSGLISIGGTLSIATNGILGNVDGLSSLTSVGGDLFISLNDALTNIDGLTNLISIGGGLYIFDNTQLSMCCALCPLLQEDTIDDTVIADIIDISNNATGCNSAQEIETTCGLLPIEMTDPLHIHLKNKIAILEWRTALEINNSGFEIQRSRDGIEWEKIGWQTGQGNASTPHTYTYTDSSPVSGTSYYRLRQVDFDGDAEYSNIVSLQYIHNGVIVYPNPVKDRLSLSAHHSFIQKITVYDSTGSQVIEIVNPDTNIDVSALPKGVYILKISIDNDDFYEKILME